MSFKFAMITQFPLLSHSSAETIRLLFLSYRYMIAWIQSYSRPLYVTGLRCMKASLASSLVMCCHHSFDMLNGVPTVPTLPLLSVGLKNSPGIGYI